ncbi:ABC transporter permease [Aeoliella sp.]|uniref:ABC transporter permease n=1 Tax=Aeoliella sp. TaxID=2795800 RepID=UPI003CCC217F
MIQEEPLLPFKQWLLQLDAERWGALPHFLLVMVVLGVLSLVIGLVIGSILYGPVKAGEKVYRVVANAFGELFHISPRRIWAIAKVAMQEAFRRRVWVAIAVFVLLLLFAGWFLKTDREPAKLFFSFVLTATSFLGLFIALLLAVFSLPNDFKSKTIYTVVTKPVRSGDIILGRILGFTVVGSVLLLLMGASSYVFVYRALQHTHTIAAQRELPERTSTNKGHSHKLEVREDGQIVAVYEHGHEHTVEQQGDQYVVSGAQGMLRAREPMYGELSFLNRQGVKVERGVSVGKEWGYRSFIEGGTQAAAVWTFEGIDEDTLIDEKDEGRFLPIEIVVRVFRTWKADINTPVQGTIQLKRPGSELKTAPEFFYADDNTIDLKYFPEELTDTNNQPVNLLEDLVDDEGRLEVVVQCLDRAQYFGFARGDCYIHLSDGSPLWNFVKAYLSIWVQMVVVIAIAVTGSTVLSGPIAMLFTVSFILLGFQRDFLMGVATGDVKGGGPIEALVRIPTHMNLISDFKDQHFGITLMRFADDCLQGLMYVLASILPDFSSLSTADYVAYGFDIPSNLVAQQLITGLGYVVGLVIVGYFLLRNREVAK